MNALGFVCLFKDGLSIVIIAILHSSHPRSGVVEKRQTKPDRATLVGPDLIQVTIYTKQAL